MTKLTNRINFDNNHNAFDTILRQNETSSPARVDNDNNLYDGILNLGAFSSSPLVSLRNSWSSSTTIVRNDSNTFDYSDKLLMETMGSNGSTIHGCSGGGGSGGLSGSNCTGATANVTTIDMGGSTASGIVVVVGTNSGITSDSGNGTILIGTDVDMSMMGTDPMHWSEIVLIICFCLFIIVTVIGNTLVILSVITTRRLRTVTNCFVMSLAVADWLVGLFVMPPAVLLYVTGTWGLGWILCDIWISLDVLLCTASILSLCAISIDRYLAVTQPLNYSRRRRSKRLALTMILVVWILALAITCPPLIGWYEPGRRERDYECRYNENKGYVVFSAMGSFFIPMTVMIYVYIRISCVIARRHDQMAEIEVHKKSRVPENFVEQELGDSSENDHCPMSPTHKKSHKDPSLPSLNNICDAIDLETNGKHQLQQQQQHRNGHYELMDLSTPTSKRSSTLTYKISGSSENWPMSMHQQQQQQQQQHQSHHQRQQSVRSTDLTSKNIRVHQKSISTRITSMKRENKTTQTLSIVVGGFIACWLPFFIVYLVTPFIGHNQISENVKTFLTWLGWVNSAMNPFIYAFYSVDFRAAFWRLTLRKFFKNSRKPPYITNNMSIRR